MTKVQHKRVTSLSTSPVEGVIEYQRQGATDRFLMYITGNGGVRYSMGVPSHAHDIATTALAGFMSAADKLKLDGINLSNYLPKSAGRANNLTNPLYSIFGNGNTAKEIFVHEPIDYGLDNPRMTIGKPATANHYNFSLWDGSSSTGRFNFVSSELTHNGSALATQSYVTSLGYINTATGDARYALAGHTHTGYVPTTRALGFSAGWGISITGDATGDLSANRSIAIGVSFGTEYNQVARGDHTHTGYVPTARTITVGTGMTGGGNLGGNISIGLSFGTNSDNVAAGNHTHTQYALTSHTHEVSQINNLTNLLNGKVGTGTSITINGVTQDLSQNRSWTVSGGGGGNISGAGTGTNSPIAIWTGTYNIAYSSLYYYTAGTPSRSVLGIGGVLIGSIGDMSLYVAGGAKIRGYVSVGIPALEKGSQYLEFEVGTTPENPRGSIPFPLISAANFEAAKARSSSLNGMFGFDTTNNVITWVQGDTIVKLGITEWGVMTKHGTSPWRYVEA